MSEDSLVVVYARVSTEEQGKKGYSIDDQLERCRNFCKARGWTIYREYSEIASGRKGKRPKFQEAVNLVREGIVDGFVTAYLDRFARNLKTFVTLCDEFMKNDKFFVAVDGSVDLTTTAGRLMANVLMAFKQYEAEDRGEKTSKGLKKAKAAGKQVGWKKGHRRIEQWKVDRIINDYKEKGITYQNAGELGVSVPTIYKILRDAGLMK